VLLSGDGGTVSLGGALTGQVYTADPALDVEIAWSDLSVDLLGLPVAVPEQLELWALTGLDPDQIGAGVLSDALAPTDVLTVYSCDTSDAGCSFSELEVFGHDYRVQDDFGVLDATWLATLSGGERRGLQALAFLEPGEGARVDIDDDSASLSLEASGGQALAVPAGVPFTIDWSELDTDASGGSLAGYRLDLLGLFHLPVEPDALAATLASDGLSGARAWWLEVPDGDSAAIDALQGDEPLAGLEPDGTWLLGLFQSTGISPLPRVLVQLDPS